ncbi:MAG: ATP-binding protein [Thiomicrospira sp.]
MTLSPHQRMLLGVFFLLFSLIVSTQLALKSPILGLTWSSDQAWPTLSLTGKSAELSALDTLSLRADFWIEEPDQLGDWARYNQLMTDMQHLYELAQSGQIRAQIDGKTHILEVGYRHIDTLPAVFWLQMIIGSIAFLIAYGVFAFRPHSPGAKQFALSGLGIFLAIIAASVYSSRELIISGELMLFLSRLNQFGAFLFTVALLSMLLHYPQKLRHANIITPFIYLFGLIAWSGFAWQWYSETSTAYISVLAIFCATFVLAAIQWRQTRHQPLARASLKWFLLSIYLGTGLFALFILIPVALNLSPPASQGMMFFVFLLMFIGIALGITRYRLFDLDRWWWITWSWLLGGAALIATDALLISLVGLKQDIALAIALAVIGWLYFPLRQAVIGRFYGSQDYPIEQIKRLIAELSASSSESELAQTWQQSVLNEWQPLRFNVLDQSAQKVSFANEGETLRLPHLSEGQLLALHYPNEGHRLFNSRDQQKAQVFYEIGRQALIGLQTRQRAEAEKQRILADLHDDVGAKLLSLLYKTEDAELNELTRSALQDLRTIVAQPQINEQPLNEALQHWQAECQQRLGDAKLQLDWVVALPPNLELSRGMMNDLARIVREALTNILKHAQGADRVSIHFSLSPTGDSLVLIIKDNGQAQAPTEWELGRGTRNIRYRVQKLGGECDWQVQQGTQLTLRLPLNPS